MKLRRALTAGLACAALAGIAQLALIAPATAADGPAPEEDPAVRPAASAVRPAVPDRPVPRDGAAARGRPDRATAPPPAAPTTAPPAPASTDPGAPGPGSTDPGATVLGTAALPPTAPVTTPPATGAPGTTGPPSPGGSPGGDPGDGPGSTPPEPTDSAPTAPSEPAEPTGPPDTEPPGTPPGAPAPPTTAPPTTTPPTTPPPATTPPADPGDCPVDENGDDPDNDLGLTLTGLPARIVAGSGWHRFTLTAVNRGDQDLGPVAWMAVIDNYSLSEDEKDWLSTHARLEYHDPGTGAWESIADEVGNGFFFGESGVGPRERVRIGLRVDIGVDAPAGDGFTLGLGGYLDSERDCVHSSFALYEFTVLPPGSDPGPPDDAAPVPHPVPPTAARPQGGLGALPADGALAATGAPSVLPFLGLAAAVAVTAGASAVLAARRRTGPGGG